MDLLCTFLEAKLLIKGVVHHVDFSISNQTHVEPVPRKSCFLQPCNPQVTHVNIFMWIHRVKIEHQFDMI